MKLTQREKSLLTMCLRTVGTTRDVDDSLYSELLSLAFRIEHECPDVTAAQEAAHIAGVYDE